MGYCMTQMEQNFRMKGENLDAAEIALKNALKKGKINAWVDNANAIAVPGLKRVMEKCRWDIVIDDTHDVEEIYFTGEKLGDDFEVFKAIAPYVEANSYIQMMGEDGYIWRWHFDGKNVIEQEGKIVFE